MRGLHGFVVLFLVSVVACDAPAPPDAPIEADAGADGGPTFECATDEVCDDRSFCNGRERCRPGAPGADARGCVPTVDVTPCLAGQTCDEATDECVTDCEVTPDADGDGVDAVVCGGTDCDDSRDDVSPSAPEICDPDDVDEDCDPSTYGARDLDGDGADDGLCCNADASLPGGRRCGTDCDDGSDARRPGADEVCDGHDDDCNGAVDEGVQTMGFADLDRDLHGDPDAPIVACLGDPELSLLADDCDDTDVRVHRGQLEVCDERDNDCDSMIDEDARTLTWYRDVDGDGFGSAASGTTVSCAPPTGHSLLGTDCDDDDRAVSPVAREGCNGRDDDCNGVADYRIAAGDFEDDDGDGAADLGCRFVGTDCDDRDRYTFEGAPEICDVRDNDCDAMVDEDAAARDWLADDDGDGFGDPLDVTSSCMILPGRVLRGGDCDDAERAVFPGALDACGAGEGRDDDCDTQIDEAGARLAAYLDGDGDGWGAGEPVLACRVPTGRVGAGGDCDDASPTRHPAATEACSGGVDDDCDGATDCADGACTLTAVCAPTGSPALELTGGGSQHATVTHALPEPVQLVLRDGMGRPVRGATVTVAGPPSSFWYPTSARTDALGRAQFIVFVGRRPGPYRWTFTAEGVTPLAVDATADPADPGEETRPVDAADTGDRPTVLPAASVGVSLERIRGSGYLTDGRIVVADDDLGCILQVSDEGIASTLAGRCRLSGMGGPGLACTPAGDGGPMASATLCDIDAMLVDAPRNRIYLVDLAHAQLRRIDLSTGTITLLADGTTPFTSGPVPVASAAIRPPFFPATVQADGDIVFAQYVDGPPPGAGPIELLRYDTASSTIALESAFVGDPDPDPIYMPGGYSAYDHTEPLGILPGAVQGGLLFRQELCSAKGSGSVSWDISDVVSGLDLTDGCGMNGGDVGALDTTSVLSRITALGRSGADDPVFAVAGSLFGGPRLYRIDRSTRIVSQLAVTLSDPITSITSRTGGPMLLGTDQTVVELPPATGGGTITVTPVGSTALTTEVAGDAIARFATSPAIGVGAVSTEPGGGSRPRAAAADGSGDGSITLTAGWLPGRYTFSLGAVDLFGVPLSGTTFTLDATTPPAGTLSTLMGTPWYVGPTDPDYRFGPVDEPASSLTIDLVTGVEIAADGTTYVAVNSSGPPNGLWRVTPAGVATRLGVGGASPAEGPLSSIGFHGIRGIELDPVRGHLYVADEGNTFGTDTVVIWRIDLSTSTVARFAGDTASTDYGDGSDRLAVRLRLVGNLAIAPDGSLYFGAAFGSSGRAGVRYIDAATGTLQTALYNYNPGSGCNPLRLYNCTYQSCALAFDAAGALLVAGQLCGTTAGCGSSFDGGILSVAAGTGAISHVAGRCGGTAAPGSLPTATRFLSPGGLLVLSPTELVVTTQSSFLSQMYVWRVPRDGRVTSILAGTGAAADVGDSRSGPATSVPLTAPRALARRPDGRVVFADERSIRMVW